MARRPPTPAPAKRAARTATAPFTDTEIRLLRALLERPTPRANPPIVIGPFTNVPAPGSPIRSDWPQDISTYVANLRHDQLKELGDAADHPQYLQKAAFYNDRAALYADQTSRLAVYFPPGTAGIAQPGIIATRSTSNWYGTIPLRFARSTNASGVAAFTASECGLSQFIHFSAIPEWSGTATLQQFGAGRMTSGTTAEGRAYGNNAGALSLQVSAAITWNIVAAGIL